MLDTGLALYSEDLVSEHDIELQQYLSELNIDWDIYLGADSESEQEDIHPPVKLELKSAADQIYSSEEEILSDFHLVVQELSDSSDWYYSDEYQEEFPDCDYNALIFSDPQWF